MSIALKGAVGELRATIHVKRAATGEVETYTLIGRTTPEQHEQILAEARQPRIHGSSGVMIGPGGGINFPTD